MKKLRAIYVNAVTGEVKEYENTGLESLQKAVGGLIEVAHHFPNGDCLLVDEEGLFKGYEHGFRVMGAHQPFAGNGVIVGPTDDEGETLPAQSKLKDICEQLIYFGMADHV